MENAAGRSFTFNSNESITGGITGGDATTQVTFNITAVKVGKYSSQTHCVNPSN